MEADKIKCAVYARVSTDQQGDSIENQVSQCREFITRLGDMYDYHDIIVYRDEAVSGYYTSVFDRQEMKQAIRDAKNARFQLLVFKEVSRVGRDKQENPAIIGMFEQYGVRVIAINDNYDSLNKDNITFDILSVLSEQESKKISARVSSARKQKARRGEWNGEPPIGYKINKETKKLEIDPEQKHIPTLIFELYVNGGLGTFKVAEHLNKLGIRTKMMNKWSRESINKILRNQAYVGNVVYGTRRNQLQREYDDDGKMRKRKVQMKLERHEWQIVEGAHEALIDKETFIKAQSILSSKGGKKIPRRASHPLTGILFCGYCGQGMVCQKRAYNGKEYRYYICKTYHKYGRETCVQANTNADLLEGEIMAAVRSKLRNIPLNRLSISVNREKDRLRLEIEHSNLHAKKERFKHDQIALFRQRELFASDAYQEQMLWIKQQIELIEQDIEKLEAQMRRLTELKEDLSPLMASIEHFMRLDIDESAPKRTLLHELIKKVVLKGNRLFIEYHYDFSR